MPIQIFKQNFGKKVNVVHTNVKFFNKTEIPIQYRIETGSWSDGFKAKDTVTDHYDLADYLSFYYDADLSGSSQSVNVKSMMRIMTNFYLLLFSLDKAATIGGSQYLREIRNIRIECHYDAGK
jgi:hypothetical protein